ncbi:MAG: DUF4349 domain-containing protein [Gammaproteobacteria bacterium]|nr:DUF4349 domain-containing protein [Gammaproteobacteria bacterium]
MKKIMVYVLVGIGIFSILLFGYRLLVPRAGLTMYGSAPSAYKALENSVVASGSAPAAMSSDPRPQAQTEPVMKRMIIRNARITLQVNDIPRVMDDITKIADQSGGYVVNSDFNQNAGYAAGEYAEISIRIPAKGLNNVINTLKGLATKVVQESVTGEDITQQYVNLESELNNLQATKAQLTKIMQGATKTADVLLVFQQLSETQKRIDILEGQIKYYKESVAYSLINISLTMNPIIKLNQDSSWNISEVITDSYQALINGLRQFTYGVIQFTIYFIPMILLWGIIILILFLIGKSIYRRVK